MKNGIIARLQVQVFQEPNISTNKKVVCLFVFFLPRLVQVAKGSWQREQWIYYHSCLRWISCFCYSFHFQVCITARLYRDHSDVCWSGIMYITVSALYICIQSITDISIFGNTFQYFQNFEHRVFEKNVDI